MTGEKQQQQQHYTVTTITKKNKKINLDKFHVQFSRAQLRRQMTFRYILIRCTTPVMASSGSRAVLCQVSLIFTFMCKVGLIL